MIRLCPAAAARDCCTSGSSSGSFRKRRRTITLVSGVAAVASLLATTTLLLFPAGTDATVQSAHLREQAGANLLFWSSYDFSVDAATQFLGPLAAALVVRGGDGTAAEDVVAEQLEIDVDIDFPIFLKPRYYAAGPEQQQQQQEEEYASDSADEDDLDAINSTVAEKYAVATNVTAGKILSTRAGAIGGFGKDKSAVLSKSKYVFSLYQQGDGSEKDPDGIPTRYLLMQDGHRDRAGVAVKETLKWREEHDIDSLLSKPQTKFDVCKQVFPHFFLGRDKDGHVVFLQRPALIDLDKARRNDLTQDELLMHYVYVNEYLWQVLDGDQPLGTMVSILDLTGLDFGVLKKPDIIGFLKTFVMTMDSHYPQRAHKTLIVNVPKWFNVMYKILSPLLRASTKSKIEVLARGKKQDDALVKALGDDVAKNLPPKFWSKKKLRQMNKNRSKNSRNKNAADVIDDGDEDDNEDGDGDGESEKENTNGENHTNEDRHHKRHHDNWVPPDSELEIELRSFVSSTRCFYNCCPTILLHRGLLPHFVFSRSCLVVLRRHWNG